MTRPFTWQFEDQSEQIWTIRNRGVRYFWVGADEGTYEGSDRWQPGDVVVLWPEDAQSSDGIAAVITHLGRVVDVHDDDNEVGTIISIGEPFAARAVTGGDEDDGGD